MPDDLIGRRVALKDTVAARAMRTGSTQRLDDDLNRARFEEHGVGQLGLDAGAAEPWGYGITGLVRSTAEWWLERRSMSRAHLTEYVSQLIWSALTGVLHEAGIRPDPNAQVPSGRPLLTLRTGDQLAGPKGSR